MKDETVWLSLEQMTKLFDRDRTVITRHINNILKDQELNKEEVCAKFAHTTEHGAIEGKKQACYLKCTPNVRQKSNIWRCIFYE